MSPDLQELEAKLHALRPAALDATLTARLADAARGTSTTPTAAETAFADSLRAIRPAQLPPALSAAIRARTSAPGPAAIPFPAPAKSTPWSRYMLPVAAAVALLGAAAALLVPTRPDQRDLANHPTGTTGRPTATHLPAPLPLRSSDFVPAGFNTDLSQASDEGVVWQTPNEARRVVKVIYRDRVTLVDPNGRKVEVEQPRVEYILLPEKID